MARETEGSQGGLPPKDDTDIFVLTRQLIATHESITAAARTS